MSSIPTAPAEVLMPLVSPLLATLDPLVAKRMLLNSVEVVFGLLFLVALVLLLSSFRGPR
jgi:hypothetical protein